MVSVWEMLQSGNSISESRVKKKEFGEKENYMDFKIVCLLHRVRSHFAILISLVKSHPKMIKVSNVCVCACEN